MSTNGETKLVNGIKSMSLDDRKSLGDVTHNNIKQLQVLVKTVGGFEAKEEWWKQAWEQCEEAKEGQEPIKLGAIITEKLPVNPPPTPKGSKALAQHQALLATLPQRLELLWIGVLKPYRRRGVGTLLKNHLDALIENDKRIEQVFVKVSGENKEALEWLFSDWKEENGNLVKLIPKDS